ncbi:MAG: 4'-phosphopantetheinyl transferase family protein [Candidatus Bruticola sp.]
MTTVKIICFNLCSFPAELESRCNILLSREELQRANKLIFPHLRRRFVLSHLGLRFFLAQIMNKSLTEGSAELYKEAAKLVFTASELGKPQLSFPKRIPFNFSHSGNWAVLAAADSSDTAARVELGIDLEEIPSHPMLALAERFFSVKEWQHLSAYRNELKQRQEFAYLWTRKEACLKMWGTGLRTRLDSFEVLHQLPVNVRSGPLPSPSCLYLKSSFFIPNMCLSLALNFHPDSLQAFLINWQGTPNSFQF